MTQKFIYYSSSDQLTFEDLKKIFPNINSYSVLMKVLVSDVIPDNAFQDKKRLL